MRILVAGGTGFMGQYIVPLLDKLGHEVVVLARDMKKAKALYGRKYKLIFGDVTQPISLIGCCENIDVIINLIALMGHDLPSEDAFERFRNVNVSGINHLVEEAKKAEINRFIHISSTAAMGLQNDIFQDENTICKPVTPYQVTKKECEDMLLQEYNDSGFPVVILRPSMIYGPGFKGDFLTIAKVCKTGFFPKIGCGDNLSPALYITDLAEMVVKFLDKGDNGEIYLLASERSYSLSETVDIICRAMGKKVHLVYCPRFIAIIGAACMERIAGIFKMKPIVTKRNILSITQDRIISVAKIKETIGYDTRVSFEEGLTKTINYFVENGYL